MTCEYCENEIPESAADFCPFCGAKIETTPAENNDERMCVKEDQEVGNSSKTDGEELPQHVDAGDLRTVKPTDEMVANWLLYDGDGSLVQADSQEEYDAAMVLGAEVIRQAVEAYNMQIASYKVLDEMKQMAGSDTIEGVEAFCKTRGLGFARPQYQPFPFGLEKEPLIKVIRRGDATVPFDTVRFDSDALKAAQEVLILGYVREKRRQGWFKGVDVSEYGFVPNSGETVYEVITDVTLNETRGIRRSHTTKTGSSSYDYEGDSESKTHYEFQEVTSGRLFLTSKRIVFTGGQQVRNIPFSDIVSFESDWLQNDGSLQVSSAKRAKTMRFTGADVSTFTALYQALQNERFRALLESGPENELVEKFKKVGLFKIEPEPEPWPIPNPDQETTENGEKCSVSGCLADLFRILAFLLILGVIIFILSQIDNGAYGY